MQNVAENFQSAISDHIKKSFENESEEKVKLDHLVDDSVAKLGF